MKRFLMLAALVGGLITAGSASTAEAHGGYRGGRHYFHGPRWGGGWGGGYGFGGPRVIISTPGFQFGYGRPYGGFYGPAGYGYPYGGGCVHHYNYGW